MNDSNDIPFNSYSIDFFGAIGDTFANSGTSFGMQVAGWMELFSSIWSLFVILSFLLSALLLFLIIYTYIKHNQLSEEEMEMITAAEAAYRQKYGTEPKNWRWEEVQKHIEGMNPNDWKLAIIEADVLLQETLNEAGYVGSSIAEQLKNISPQQVRTIQAAWDAHKIRNQIAHSGSDFVLTKRVAQEAVAKYRLVFEEFGVL